MLAEAANRFFSAWHDLLVEVLQEAKSLGKLRAETDTESLSHLIISSIEGSLVLYKASRDPEAFVKIGAALKASIFAQMV